MIVIMNRMKECGSVQVLRRRADAVAVLVLALAASVVAGCGQSESEEKTDGGSASGGSASGGSSSGSGKDGGQEFQGVLDSYGTAQAEIDGEGGEQEVGDYRVGYIVEPAEPWWEGDPGNLTLRKPAAGETNHIEILPFEARTGLLIPYMEGTLTVLDESGEEVDRKPLQFYRGEFYHYANNFSLPQSGPYTLRAEMQPPTFLRHETEVREGRVLTQPISVEFENVEIDTEGE
jgi:Fe2+ transport protein